MPRVKFLKDHTTKSCPEDRQSFEKDEVYDLSDASARHFTSRGLAVMEGAEPPKRQTARPEKADDVKPAQPPHGPPQHQQTGSK